MATTKNARKSTEAERKAKLEALRKQQRSAERRSRLIWVSVGSVVVLALLAVIGVAVIHKNNTLEASAVPTSISGGTAVTQAATTGTADTADGIDGVMVYTNTDGSKLEATHVDGPVTYSVTPPIGGPHNVVWMNCGVYSEVLPNERAVHNLEHGVVWITYQPTLAAADVTTLVNLVKKQSVVKESGSSTGLRYMDLSPYPGIDSPIVVSSWGHQLKVTSPTDPRIQQFIDKFRANATFTPEFGASCSGEPSSVAGTPSID